MRTVSTDFLTAEAQQVQSPRFQVVARPNPEVLDWQKTYTNTGKTGTHAPAAGASYGWLGNDYPDGDYPVGSSVVTPAGTLIRSYGVSIIYDATAPIYLNRVVSTAPDIQAALSVWTSVTTGILNVTREALSADATRVRLFYVRVAAGLPELVYKQSTNDGVTWGAEVVVFSPPSGPQPDGTMSDVWSSAVLSSPHPDVCFFIRRMSGNGVTGDPSCNWLELYAFEWTGGSWKMTQHTKPMTAPDIASINTFWSGSFMFDSTVIDPVEGSYAVVYMDDLAGRPASTVYSNQFWSDSFTVEQIDFAEPEHDEIIGMRLAKIGNKLILIARRTMADSDFWSTQQGVMYYSVDGKRWSDAYYVCKAEDYNWGMPQLWLGKLAIVGMDSVWTATPTPMFGGIAAFELDLTDSTTGASVDEPEDRTTASTATLNLLNDQRQWSNHGVVTAGGELEIRAGYHGTRRNLMDNPSFETSWGTPGPWTTLPGCTVGFTFSDFIHGVNCLQVISNNLLPYLTVTTPVLTLPVIGETMTFSGYLKNNGIPSASVDPSIYAYATWHGGASEDASDPLLVVGHLSDTTSWWRFALTVTPDKVDRTGVKISIRFDGITHSGQAFYVDDVQFEEGSGVTPYDDDTIGWDDTEMPTMFVGRLGNPNPQVDPHSGSMSLTATDYLDNFKQGVLERTLVYSSTVHDAFPMVDKADLGAFATHIGNFEWRDDGTDQFVRATKAGFNTMFRSSGLTGSQQFSFQVRVEDIFPQESSWHVFFQVNERWDQLYEVRGNNASGSDIIELWKRRSVVRASGHIDIFTTLLASSTPGQDAYTPHGWNQITVTQRQQHILVTKASGLVAIDYFDTSPLIDSGIVAFGATIPDDATPPADPTATPPVPDSPYDTVDYRDIRFSGDEVETSVEEFFQSIATMRGFDTFVAEAVIDEPFTDLTNWQTIGDASHWTGTPGGLIADDGYIFGTHLSGLRHKTYKAQDAMMDVDAILGDGFTPAAEIGFLMRANSAMTQYVAIVLGYNHDTVTFYEKLTTSSIITQVVHGVLSAIPFHKILHFRVVASGHWYTLYCNDMFIATFYSANLLVSGYWGLLFNPAYTGSAGTTGYQINVTRLRIPILGLGSLPYIQPGAKLDAVVNDLITGQNGWIAADGRTLRMGKTLGTTIQQNVGSTLWLSGGYQKDYGDQATACRVVSTDADGNQITGVAYSPSLWKSKARPVWRIEQVPDLRNAAECRTRAWGFLTDQSKVGRTRSYGVHPQLRWQRFDLLFVTNYLDDTQENLYVLGTSRNWTRDPKSGVVTLAMNARLEEQVGDTLDQATYYPP